MSTSKDPRDRKTYDPFGKPGDGGENGSGSNRGSAGGGGFGYSGGDSGGYGQGGYGTNGTNGGFGYNGGYSGGGAGQNGSGQDNGFYGPDYFSGGYANRGGYRNGYPGGGTPNAPGGGYGYGYGYQAPRRSPGYGISIASMILGIGALFLSWSVWVSLICGILAVVFACVGRARDGKFSASAKAGLITGIIAIVVVIALIVCFIFFGDKIMAFLEELSNRLEQQYPNTPGNGSGSGTTNPGSGSGDRAQLFRLPLLWE